MVATRRFSDLQLRKANQTKTNQRGNTTTGFTKNFGGSFGNHCGSVILKRTIISINTKPKITPNAPHLPIGARRSSGLIEIIFERSSGVAARPPYIECSQRVTLSPEPMRNQMNCFVVIGFMFNFPPNKDRRSLSVDPYPPNPTLIVRIVNDCCNHHAFRAQRNFAGEERGLSWRSVGEGRMTSWAMSA
jgi:hypothetical protein